MLMFTSEVTILGVCLGLAITIFYVPISVCKTKNPTLSHVLVIMISSVTAVAGFYFGTFVLTAPPNSLGQLEDHLLTMILGAIAVTWVSIDAIVKIFYSLFTE